MSNETLLDYPFLEEFVIHRIDGAHISAGSAEITVHRRGSAWVLDRDQMFRGMLERAASEGVEVVFKRWKRPSDEKVIIGADGANSVLRREVTKEPVSFILGYQADISWKEDDHYVRVDFGPWSDTFFGWVIPLGDGRAHLGIGVSPSSSGQAQELLKVYAKHLGIKPPSRGEGRIIPISKPLRRVASGSILLVGDAAVHVKASTGGGISWGLRGADGAVETINRYLGGEGSLLEYNGYHRRELYPNLKLHYALHKLYNSLDVESLLRWMDEHEYVRVLEAKGKMDYPLSLWHPSLLSFIARSAGPFLHILRELL